MNVSSILFFLLLLIIALVSIPWYSTTLFTDPQHTDSTCKYIYLFASPKSLANSDTTSCTSLVKSISSIPSFLHHKQSCNNLNLNQSYLIGKFYTPSVLHLDDDLHQSFYCLQNNSSAPVQEFFYQVCGCAFTSAVENHDSVPCLPLENSAVQTDYSFLEFNISLSMKVWWKMEPIFLQSCHLQQHPRTNSKSNKFFLQVNRSEDSPNYIILVILCMVILVPYFLSVPLQLLVKGLEAIASHFLNQRAFIVQEKKRE